MKVYYFPKENTLFFVYYSKMTTILVNDFEFRNHKIIADCHFTIPTEYSYGERKFFETILDNKNQEELKEEQKEFLKSIKRKWLNPFMSFKLRIVFYDGNNYNKISRLLKKLSNYYFTDEEINFMLSKIKEVLFKNIELIKLGRFKCLT